jgi:hypothetical protein
MLPYDEDQRAAHVHNLQTFKKTKYILSKLQIESYIQHEIYEPY